MNYLEQKRYADSQSLEWLIDASQGQEEHPYIDRFILHSAVGDKLEQQASFEALQAKAEGAADPQTTAVERQIEEAQRVLAEQEEPELQGGIAGVDPGMDQELAPEEMAALQSGIAGAPPANMAQQQPQQMPQQAPQGQMPQGQPNMMAAGGGLIPGYQNGGLPGGPDPDIVGYVPGGWSAGAPSETGGVLSQLEALFSSPGPPDNLPEILGSPGILEAIGPAGAGKGLITGLRYVSGLRNPAARKAAWQSLKKVFGRKPRLPVRGRADSPASWVSPTVGRTPFYERGAAGARRADAVGAHLDDFGTGIFRPIRQAARATPRAATTGSTAIGPYLGDYSTPGRIRRGLSSLRRQGPLLAALGTVGGVGTYAAGREEDQAAREREPLLNEDGELVPSKFVFDPESWLGGYGGRGFFGEESPSGLESLARWGANLGIGAADKAGAAITGSLGILDDLIPDVYGPFTLDDRMRARAAEEGYSSVFGQPFGVLPDRVRVPTDGSVTGGGDEAADAGGERLLEILQDEARRRSLPPSGAAGSTVLDQIDAMTADTGIDDIQARIDELENALQTISPQRQEYHELIQELSVLKLARAEELKNKQQGYMESLMGRERSKKQLDQERLAEVMLTMGTGMGRDPREFPEVMRETSRGLRSLDTLREQERYDLQDRIQNMDIDSLREWMQSKDLSEGVREQIAREIADVSVRGKVEMAGARLTASENAENRRQELAIERIRQAGAMEQIGAQESGALQRARLDSQANFPQLFNAINEAAHTVKFGAEDPARAEEALRQLHQMFYEFMDLSSAMSPGRSAIMRMSEDELTAMFVPILNSLPNGLDSTDEEMRVAVQRYLTTQNPG